MGEGAAPSSWLHAACAADTVAVYMGAGDAPAIARALIGAGKPASTPVVVVENASQADARTLSGTLVGLPELAAQLRSADASDRYCPRCGGLPQVAVFPETGETLLTAQRTLVCSRCANEWVMSRMTCASCGETSGAKMPILSDVDLFPHLRIDACEICRRYLITVDQRKDPRAVPIVDELAALPLDLVAAERGYTKIARNLMGF